MIRGRILHRIAALVCSAKTLERVVEPAIADVQRDEQVLPLRGYLAVVTVIVLCAFDVSDTTGDERRALSQTFLLMAKIAVGVTGVLLILPLGALREPWHVVYVFPQTLPFAIPLAMVFGVALGVRVLEISSSSIKSIIAAAAVMTTVCFVTVVWILPVTNQSFRRAASGQPVRPTARNEMTLSELRREIRETSQSGEPGTSQELAWYYHLKWALPAATLCATTFALVAARFKRSTRVVLSALGSASYLPILFAGERLVEGGAVPAFAGAWLPNIVLIMVATAMVRVKPMSVRLKPDTTY